MVETSTTSNNTSGEGLFDATSRKKTLWVVAGLAVVFCVIVAGIVAVTIRNRSRTSNSVLSYEMERLADDFFQWQLDDLPQFASQVGYRKNSHLMNNYSMEAFDRRLQKVKDLLYDLDYLEPTLTQHYDVINVRVLRDMLETYRDGFKFKSFLMPVNNKEGIRKSLPHLLGDMRLASPRDYDKVFQRLESAAIQADEMVHLMKMGVQMKITQHHHSVKNVPSQINTFLGSSPEKSVIYKKFFTENPLFLEEELEELQMKAKDVIGNKLTPAMRRLADYIANEYQTRPEIAVTSMPDGEERYRQLIKIHTGSSKSPQEIHDVGKAEVARIEALMQQVATDSGHNVSAQEFSSLLRMNESNFFDSEEAKVQGATDTLDLINSRIPNIFTNPPEIDCIVKGEPTTSSAYYRSSDREGERPGVYHIGTKSLRSWAKYEIVTLTLHETNPGHHLQASHAIASKHIPDFRSFRSGYSSAAANPSAFPVYSEYVEGWGLYSEKLGFDLGVYEDPLDRYGHYSMEIFRACRLVVDTGIHALGWTRDQAIDYMLQHTAKTRVNIEDEVDRYISWPGQALGYKMGELQITEMRKKAEETLGDKFNLKEFHDVVLDALGPMDLVRQEVQRWTQKVLNPPRKDPEEQ